MTITPFSVAQRFIGIREVAGQSSNPLILGMLQLDTAWPKDDEVPWCSAFMNFIFHILALPRSRDLRARSWLNVGIPIQIYDAKPGFDVVILSRGDNPESGHVGLFASSTPGSVNLLAGNQDNTVSVKAFPVNRIVGIRRITWET